MLSDNPLCMQGERVRGCELIHVWPPYVHFYSHPRQLHLLEPIWQQRFSTKAAMIIDLCAMARIRQTKAAEITKCGSCVANLVCGLLFKAQLPCHAEQKLHFPFSCFWAGCFIGRRKSIPNVIIHLGNPLISMLCSLLSSAVQVPEFPSLST